MASTKPRLLLDESITEPLASYIVGLVPSAKLSKHILGQGAKDQGVAICANNERRTIVAIDSDFKNYHVEFGVIKINSPDRADDHCLYEIFYAFWKSGLRSAAKSKRTFLTREGMRIHNGVPVEKRWHPKPCTQVRRAIRLISAVPRKRR
jgi:hypothetical protein